eukprot:gene23399-23429_t
MITSAQIRAARALLGMDQKTLAEKSGLSLPTIQRMEASDGQVRGVVDSLVKVVQAIESAGVELIGENAQSTGGGRGLVTVLREGSPLKNFRMDAMAGLTVAIVALPLSMAIAIASGATPAQGLYTAAVGGFLVSLLGGSRFQIGGPAGAFIVLVAATVARHGIEGMLLATLMAGVFLVAAGALRLGTFVKFIPYPVTVGFTTGIAVIIFASQIKDLFGLTLQGKAPGEFAAKLEVLAGAAGTVNAAAVALAVVTIGIILGLRKLRPHWPGMLVAVV